MKVLLVQAVGNLLSYIKSMEESFYVLPVLETVKQHKYCKLLATSIARKTTPKVKYVASGILCFHKPLKVLAQKDGTRVSSVTSMERGIITTCIIAIGCSRFLNITNVNFYSQTHEKDYVRQYTT